MLSEAQSRSEVGEIFSSSYPACVYFLLCEADTVGHCNFRGGTKLCAYMPMYHFRTYPVTLCTHRILLPRDVVEEGA